MSTPPNNEHVEESTATASKPKILSAEKPECEDENRNVAKSTASEDITEDVVMTEAKPTTSAAAAAAVVAHEIERKNIAGNKTNESNVAKAMTSSISPSNSSSSEYEHHVEKNVERKLLRKIEYILMDIIQNLSELENDHLGICSSGSEGANNSGNSNAISISNNPIATTSRPLVTITAPPSNTSDRPTDTIHNNEEIPTNIIPPNDATAAADSNSMASSSEQ